MSETAPYSRGRVGADYARLLLEVLSGPRSSDFAVEFGPAALNLIDALLQRYERRISTPSDVNEMDEVDWAAIREIGPVMDRLYDDNTLYAVAGMSKPDLNSVVELAVGHRRRYSTTRDAVVLELGRCAIEFPHASANRRLSMVAVPDAMSWVSVVPNCARDRREEVVAEIRRHFRADGQSRIVLEVAVDSAEDLRAWLRHEVIARSESG